jgi:hypothetical protein
VGYEPLERREFSRGHHDRAWRARAAITAQLAKPQEQASALSRFAKKTRFELLSWFGIVGAVVTLTSNLQSALTLARWTRHFLESWTSTIAYVWHYALFFLPKVYTSDAVVLTIASFAIVNMIASLTRQAGETARSRMTRATRIVSIVIASTILAGVFFSGFSKGLTDEVRAGGPDCWAPATTRLAGSGRALRRKLGARNHRPGNDPCRHLTLTMLVGFITIPLLPAAVAYRLLRATTSVRLSGAALAARLWRVVAGICVVIALNYLSLWIEQQPPGP